MKAMQLVSESHLKFFRSLTIKKHREHEKKFLIEGTHLISEALKSDWKVETLVLTRNSLKNEEIVDLLRTAKNKNIELFELKEQDLHSLTDTVTPQGIVGVVQQKSAAIERLWDTASSNSLVVALDNISDPGNAGSILRTCDWFGVNAVLLSNNSVELFNQKVIRSTMGSVFHLSIYQNLDLRHTLGEAKENGYRIVTTLPERGENLGANVLKNKSVLVFGSEAHGISPEIQQLADESVTISKYGNAESLNVAIACGIVLSSWRSGQK